MEENQTTNTTPTKSENSKKWIMIAAAVIIIIAVAAAGGFFFLNSNSSSSDSVTEGENTGDDAMMDGDVMMEDETEVPGSMEGDETSYTDGTYTAVGTYSYHDGTEDVEVTLTIESGIVTEAEVINLAVDPVSQSMQDDFIENYESEVIGANITELELGKVSGSSLTPLGFNAAVEDIKLQAQS